MVKTHPLVEAAAKAIHKVTSDESWELVSRLAKQQCRYEALATIRVILSAEPSDAHILAVAHAYTGTAESIIHASNAALLREIEGSVPPSRDVGT